MLRIPTVSSFTWRQYKENWIELDAPRHFFLHSKKSIDLLAEKTGFKIDRYIYDSNELQFFSELYVNDIPLKEKSEKGYISNTNRFSKKEIAKFRRESKILNQKHEGSRFCAFLKK